MCGATIIPNEGKIWGLMYVVRECLFYSSSAYSLQLATDLLT